MAVPVPTNTIVTLAVFPLTVPLMRWDEYGDTLPVIAIPSTLDPVCVSSSVIGTASAPNVPYQDPLKAEALAVTVEGDVGELPPPAHDNVTASAADHTATTNERVAIAMIPMCQCYRLD
jgi:hypothetical protein